MGHNGDKPHKAIHEQTLATPWPLWNNMVRNVLSDPEDYPDTSENTMKNMMTSSNGDIFRVTVSLWGKYNGDWSIPLTKNN